jgi:BirA family biotin operon repressor/biotin-[acetyl-CoA-carboxylase] ligase
MSTLENRASQDSTLSNTRLTVKEQILSLLAENVDHPISGQRLAHECGVSRTAIWKAVASLRGEGYSIEAAQKAGYRLDPATDILSSAGIMIALEEDRQTSTQTANIPHSRSITVHKSIDSTNTQAKRLLAEVATFRTSTGTLTQAAENLHTAVIIAQEQTGGRGRLGRSFYSPPNSGLYISCIYFPKTAVHEPASITAAAAVAIRRALYHLYHIESSIKWVNDLFLDGKKICGILTEGITDLETGTIDALVIGAGINLRTPQGGFPGEISSVAGALQNTGFLQDNQETSDKDKSHRIFRNDVAAAVMHELLSVFQSVESNDIQSIMTEYKQHSLVLGKTLQISSGGESYHALATDIDSQAHLIVTTDDGKQKILHSGEVSLSSSFFTEG